MRTIKQKMVELVARLEYTQEIFKKPKKMLEFKETLVEQAERQYLEKISEKLSDKIQEEVEVLKHQLDIFSKRRTEGLLVAKENGRFEINGLELSCGVAIEYFVTDENHEDHGWNFGRVEYSEGYRFFNVSGWQDFPLQARDLVAVRS